LLIDDDESLCAVVGHQLEGMGYQVQIALSGREGLERFQQAPAEIVVTDVMMPDISGLEVLRQIKRVAPKTIVIIITAYGTVEDAIRACELGADDYLTKPFSQEQLRFALAKAERLRHLEEENVRLQAELMDRFRFENLVARSAAMEEVLRMAYQVAQSDSTVLIQGESGTGKEILARAIHHTSPRRGGPFVAVSCPSIPEHLVESELFGHVRGAFTGAIRDKPGKFELADGGTLFLDEIGDLKLDLQAKLLRVLQEREVERVGATRPRPINVRVIAATHRDLFQLVRENRFREDLYYRLSVVPIVIPPLREHKEDIPFLVDHFIRKHGGGRRIVVDDAFLQALMEYDWPGNVRELENVIERAIVLTTGERLTWDKLPPQIRQKPPSSPFARESQPRTLEEIEREAIWTALERHGWNQTATAKALGIPRHVLLYRMKKLGIQRPSLSPKRNP